eukprot:6134572-Prymnesium_polylepis.3
MRAARRPDAATAYDGYGSDFTGTAAQTWPHTMTHDRPGARARMMQPMRACARRAAARQSTRLDCIDRPQATHRAGTIARQSNRLVHR